MKHYIASISILITSIITMLIAVFYFIDFGTAIYALSDDDFRTWLCSAPFVGAMMYAVILGVVWMFCTILHKIATSNDTFKTLR
jgi:uncharacterized integral membrane protein